MTDPEAISPPQERIILQSDTDTVRLMQLVPDDDQAYFGLISQDPDHLRQHGDSTADKYPDAEAVRQSIEQPSNPNKYRFGIWDGDVMVGSDNLTLEGDGKAELGSWVGKHYTGRNYAGRGRSLLVEFAFNQLGLDEVHCDITVGNDASRRSVEKSGFQFAGEFTDEHGKQQWRYVLEKPAISPEVDHSKVAPTAYGVAYLRTFSDIPLTTEVFNALEEHMRETGQTYVPGSASKDRLAPQLEARYKLVDTLVAESGLTQIIELASGIAPRGMSTAMARPDVSYVELDLPGVMEEKEAIFSRLKMPRPANLHFVAGDALSSEDITSAAAEFSSDKSVAVVNEGLMRYLTFPEKTVLARNVHTLLEAYGGVWITPDISLRSALAREDEAAKGHTDSLRRTTGIDVSQNVFEDVEQAQRFFEDLGFTVERHSFLEVSDELVSPAKLGMSAEDVTKLNEPCVAFVMRAA